MKRHLARGNGCPRPCGDAVLLSCTFEVCMALQTMPPNKFNKKNKIDLNLKTKKEKELLGV